MVKYLKIDVIIPNKKSFYDNIHVIVKGFVKFQAPWKELKPLTMDKPVGQVGVFSKSSWHAHIEAMAHPYQTAKFIVRNSQALTRLKNNWLLFLTTGSFLFFFANMYLHDNINAS